MKTLKRTFLIILLTSFILNSNAQDTTRTFIISGVPQYVFNHGLHIDVEKRLRNKRQWIIVSPEYYMGWINASNSSSGYEFDSSENNDSLIGFGINVTHKIFLTKRDRPVGGYFAYSGVYEHFSNDYYAYDWREYTQNGQQYYRNTLTHFTDRINKFGINTTIGIQGIITDYIIYDVYLGLGARFSRIQAGLKGANMYNEFYWSYGYSGPILILGARIGVLLF